MGYLKHKRLGEVACRFDVVAVTLDSRNRVSDIRHLKNAFTSEGWLN
jgi:Holliday junction resolvase-like predicted endonuclease